MAIDLSMFLTTDEEGTEIELPRPETKSWPDVIQVINHWHGEPAGDPVIMRFIGMYSVGVQWDWFDSYKLWQQEVLVIELLAINETNASRQPDEEGNLPEPLPLPDMPERPVLEDPNVLLDRALTEILDEFAGLDGWKRELAERLKVA